MKQNSFSVKLFNYTCQDPYPGIYDFFQDRSFAGHFLFAGHFWTTVKYKTMIQHVKK